MASNKKCKCKECKCGKKDPDAIIPIGIEVKKSSINGYGVFATQDFKKGDTVESCVVVKDTINTQFTMVEDKNQRTAFMDIVNASCLPNYRFVGSRDKNGAIRFWIVASGYAMLYNSGYGTDKINVEIAAITYDRLMKIRAKKDIKKGDELLLEYKTIDMKRNEGNSNDKS